MRFVGRGVRDIASNMKLEDRTKPDARYAKAKTSLADHFRKLSSSNITFQRYFFGWLRQRNDESFNAFHTSGIPLQSGLERANQILGRIRRRRQRP